MVEQPVKKNKSVKMQEEVKVNPKVNKTGFYVSLIVTILAVVTFGIAICTPPVSGPFCKGSCVGYPYSDFSLLWD